jgi:hypothetical protein
MDDSTPWWIYLLVFGLLFYFNPSEQKHEEAVAHKIESFCKDNPSATPEAMLLCNEFGLGLIKMIIPELVTRQNFLFFSLTKIENEEQSTIIGIGVANYVFIFGDIGERLSQSKKSESSSD